MSLTLHNLFQLLELCSWSDSHTVFSTWYLLTIYCYVTVTSCPLLRFPMHPLHCLGLLETNKLHWLDWCHWSCFGPGRPPVSSGTFCRLTASLDSWWSNLIGLTFKAPPSSHSCLTNTANIFIHSIHYIFTHRNNYEHSRQLQFMEKNHTSNVLEQEFLKTLITLPWNSFINPW